MGCLSVKANECEYKQREKRMKEQFINELNYNKIITEIIKELTTIKKTNEITGDQMLSWTKRVEAQTAQKAILYITKESRESDIIKKAKENCDNTKQKTYSSKCTRVPFL